MTEAEYHEAFRARLVALREALGWTQREMAQALGVSLDSYKKYEKRTKEGVKSSSKFPPHLYEQLALVTHRDLDFIVTGRSAARHKPRAVA